ncbi:hypothetical protein ANCCAN_29222 [Ancylostoma caninum]|uniref:Acyl-CoA dehydrogenase/oxidase C-terminal domain-containing protein n=1 Tax=Ancylostoma caninum TaxID=29170 RepID=A0A368F225_ANCCA|nr:hypothetical protein ANCCAN_29222 [Ancylostoma caninum]
MLNITRIHNAVASVSGMRRMISLARDYATRRVVFGQTQAKWPLHTATLAKMEVETRGCFLLLMEAAQLMGLSLNFNLLFDVSFPSVFKYILYLVTFYNNEVTISTN